MLPTLVALLAMASGLAHDDEALPTLEVTEDDTVITRSCTVVIPKDVVIADANRDGVIQIRSSGIRVRFADGSVLRGASPDARPDSLEGFGIRIDGAAEVTIQGARVSGFRCAIWATHGDRLRVEDSDVSGNRRAFLQSSPAAENAADWLSPHDNDANEWLQRYGAAIYIEDSRDVTVRRCRTRRGQNGLCLDRVTDSKIYDNDFSFLSGWGIALWRSSGNLVSRNALDFCVRGYSHGVYNRGQDSAGILCFEQCNHNIFVENSATHSGDGFFGFAGKEAIAQAGIHPGDWYRRRGNNDNLLVANDFSHAAAHGIEMTFSFGNRFHRNRLVGNAICGVWGGYSQDTLITENILEENGEFGYGLERGGVNIEHGRGNRIIGNRFARNRCGVHLWWDPEGDFATKPWGAANGTASTENLITGNSFERDAVAFHFRGPGQTTLGPNSLNAVERELDKDDESKVMRTEDRVQPEAFSNPTVLGDTRPVGARSNLRGRENIIMTAWGPWDHQAPLIRRAATTSRAHIYELREMPAGVQISVTGERVKGELLSEDSAAIRYAVHVLAPGVFPYTLVASVPGGYREAVTGLHVSTRWDTRFFKWKDEQDPRQNLLAWRVISGGEKAVKVSLDELRLRYAMGGPVNLRLAKELDDSSLGSDHFGMVARTRLPLTVGQWRFRTLSDDGVRVTVDGKVLLENWTRHGPTWDSETLTVDADRVVEIVVEHFEINGYAVLELEISPVGR